MKLALILLTTFTISIKLYCQPAIEARLEFTTAIHDFGIVNKEDGETICSFEYKNTGQLPLVIKNVKPESKCLAPSWSKDSIPPGTKGYIRVHFNPEEITGTFKKTVAVCSNAKNGKVVLTISGKVVDSISEGGLKYKIGDLNLKTKHINLGNIYKGETKVTSIPIANVSDKTISVALEEVPVYIHATVEPSKIKPGGFGKIIIKFDTKKIDEWDNVIDRIVPVINNKKWNNDKIAITANIREDFGNISQEEQLLLPNAFFPATIINFDTLTTSLPVRNSFRIRNDGKSNLIIRDVNPSCGCTAVKPVKNVLAPGDSTYIEVVFSPKDQTGDFNKGITVITNDPKLSRQYLWVKGYVKK
jgi:hypothetical protein